MKKLKIWSIISVVLVVLFSATIIVLSIFGANKNEKPYNPSYVERKLIMYEFENNIFAKEQIAFIGDSITDLYTLDNFYTDLPVATYNRGIGGDKTQDVLDRLKVSLFDLSPSKVVLMIGINDINFNVAEDKMLENYRSILSQISTNLPETEVFCMSILPMNETIENYSPVDVEKGTQIILNVNPQIEQLAEEFDYEYVDLFSEFADANNNLIEDYSLDGLHINHNGYVKWSSIMKPLLA